MEEAILKILDVQRNNAIDVKQLYKRVGYSNVSFDEFCKVIDEMSKDKKIYNTGHGYTLNPFVLGTYHCNKYNEEYVSYQDKKITIKSNNKYKCLDKDLVLVRITDFNTYTGNIKEIVKRHGIVGEVKTSKNVKYVVCNDDVYLIDRNDIVDGTIVGVLVEDVKSGRFYRAKVDTILGHKTDPDVDLREILYNYDFIVGFSKEIEKELEDVPVAISDSDIVGRKDLRSKMIFTIDGDDTKDIDDAISLDILDNGNYLLGVHIADVAHYVKEGSAIDLRARDNATSVYMPGSVNPMYPRKLSNGICSLNPDVDRLAISCMMELDSNGKIVNKDIFKSVIHSRKQMTYKKVNSILEKNIVPDDYVEYKDVLRAMNKLAKILHDEREKRGALEFFSQEIKILVDDNGKPIQISQRESGEGEKLIEEFMLRANETVATYLQDLGVHSIYRVHDLPDVDRLKKVIEILKNYGNDIKFKASGKNLGFVKDVVDWLKDSKNRDIYSMMILRCMAKACYKTINIGHFGVGISAYKKEAYTHFTSPIRRYPDTCIHRILTAVLDGEIEKVYQDEFLELLNEICYNSSLKEIDSEKAEREANKMKAAEYMQGFIGSCYKGRISGFTKSGMFVMLPNLIEGRLDFRELDGFYYYDMDREIIVEEKTHKVYRLGDKIDVCVIRSSKEDREIDFALDNKHVNVRKKD